MFITVASAALKLEALAPLGSSSLQGNLSILPCVGIASKAEHSLLFRRIGSTVSRASFKRSHVGATLLKWV